MKPRYAKELCKSGNGVLENKITNSMEWDFRDGAYYWKSLRSLIEAIEAEGYKVSITKDGKEYNK